MNIFRRNIIFVALALLSACSEPYEGTFIGKGNSGQDVKFVINGSELNFGGVDMKYKLASHQELNSGSVYALQIIDPKKPKEDETGFIMTVQTRDKKIINLGISQHGLIVTGFNTLKLERQ